LSKFLICLILKFNTKFYGFDNNSDCEIFTGNSEKVIREIKIRMKTSPEIGNQEIENIDFDGKSKMKVVVWDELRNHRNEEIPLNSIKMIEFS